MTFAFNGKWDDLEQVAEFLPAFTARRDELGAANRYPYNDDFRGHIPGIEGEWEDRAIYLLQTLYRFRQQEQRINKLLAEGFEHLTELEHETRFRRVVFYPKRNLGGEWQEWSDARLLPEVKPNQAAVTGQIRAVLPKGKRTNGHLCLGRGVLVLR